MSEFKVNRRRFDPYKNFKFRLKPAVRKPVRGDINLPPEGFAVLDDIVGQVRLRGAVDDDPGHNVTALFAGPNGTGKTMAAEVIADQLGLDLYRVDLSSVVSSYIGETEKHLSRVFEAADTAGAVLLFDEADALFGKRSDVRDSHDRYANIEVNYLLQRLEEHPGPVIFATSGKNNIDPAFIRRIRYVIDFPPPGR